jgi:hypothetical protein
MNTIPPHDARNNLTPKTTFIYTLSDPETNEIRYIGKADDLTRRLSGHLNDRKVSHKRHWISSLKRRGLKPLIQVIEEVPIDSWGERERYWIDFYRTQGCHLTNTALGGEGGNPSPETKAKIGAAHRGKKRGKQPPRSKEWRENLSKAKRGKKQSPERGAKVAIALRGRKRSPETIAKMLATKSERTYTHPKPNLGKSPSPETKAKIAASLTGRKLPPEVIEKRSASVRGSTRSPETRAKIGAAKRGVKRKPFTRSDKGKPRKPLSPETKANLSLAMKRSHAMRKSPPPDAPTLWD